MRASTFTVIITILLALIILSSSFFTVEEGQQAILLRLGQIVNDDKGVAEVIQPGLHFKWPIIIQVRKFDTRLQTLLVQSSRILTEEQKYVLVDYYIKWKINNVPLYYQRTGGNALQAQTLLQQQVNDALRAAFGERTITDMVSGERVNVMALLRSGANATAHNLGIWVGDVRIKSIDLPDEVSTTVFSRMRTKREQVATQHRANGIAKAEAIRAQADAQAAVSIAEAQNQAANLRAQGMKRASQIYNSAYTVAPDFYVFLRSLQVYQSAFNTKRDFLILSPQSELFKYFNSATGQEKP
ncbi:MAG: protease modulator HflC [Gammaproteobacteria bacterium]